MNASSGGRKISSASPTELVVLAANLLSRGFASTVTTACSEAVKKSGGRAYLCVQAPHFTLLARSVPGFLHSPHAHGHYVAGST